MLVCPSFDDKKGSLVKWYHMINTTTITFERVFRANLYHYEILMASNNRIFIRVSFFCYLFIIWRTRVMCPLTLFSLFLFFMNNCVHMGQRRVKKSLKVKKDYTEQCSRTKRLPFSQFLLRKEAKYFKRAEKECFRWLIKFLRWSTTQQLVALNKHHWLGVRKEIIYYQCLSGATPGLWKKPGWESGGEQCSQLLLTRQDKKKPQQPFPIRWSSSYQGLSVCLLNI